MAAVSLGLAPRDSPEDDAEPGCSLTTGEVGVPGCFPSCICTSSRPDTVPTPELVAGTATMPAGVIWILTPPHTGPFTISVGFGPVLEFVTADDPAYGPTISTTDGAAVGVGS